MMERHATESLGNYYEFPITNLHCVAVAIPLSNLPRSLLCKIKISDINNGVECCKCCFKCCAGHGFRILNSSDSMPDEGK